MALGTCIIEITGERLDGTPENKARLRLVAQGSGIIRDEAGDEIKFPAQFAKADGVAISLPYAITLFTDTATGEGASTTIGYEGYVATDYGRLTFAFGAPEAGSTTNLVDLTDSVVTPISDLQTFRDEAETARDEAVAAAASVPTEAELSATIETEGAAVVGDALGAYLDIWDPYDAGASDTYTGFMAYIDGLLAAAITAGTVVKTDHGAGSSSAHIYSYTAGATNAPHLLLLGGSHPDESLSMKAAMRWFEQFAIGTHPAMVALRTQLRVTWIPVVTPSGYRSSRQNANLVNVARNYDFYWPYYSPPTTDSAKGTAAFSEPEALVVKGLCDTYKVAALVDCHTIASSDSTGAIALLEPSAFIAHNYDLAYGAVSRWRQVYDTADYGWRQLGVDYRSVPTAASWAAKYLRITKERFNAAAVTVESPESWSGSTMNSITRKGIRDYCGYITLWVREWLQRGQASIIPLSHTLYAQRQDGVASGTNVDVGGTRIAGSNVWQALTFTTYDEYTTDPGGNRNYIDIPIIYPGSIVVNVNGYLLAGADTTFGQLTMALGLRDAPDAGASEAAGFSQQTTSFTPCDIPATVSGARYPFSFTDRYGYLAADVGKIKRLRLLFNKVGGWVGPDVVRARVQVQFYPGEIHSSNGPLRLPVRKSVSGI